MDNTNYTTEHRKGQHLLSEERHEIEVRLKDGLSLIHIYILDLFGECGYNVTLTLVNAKDYGVAEERRRVFYIGIRRDLGVDFSFPRGSTAVSYTHLSDVQSLNAVSPILATLSGKVTLFSAPQL